MVQSYDLAVFALKRERERERESKPSNHQLTTVWLIERRASD